MGLEKGFKMSAITETCPALEELQETVRNFIKTYSYNMNKLSGWSESAYESFESTMRPHIDKLLTLIGEK